jgi:hypothetical protein
MLQRSVHTFGFGYTAFTAIFLSVVFLLVDLCGIVRSKGYFVSVFSNTSDDVSFHV